MALVTAAAGPRRRLTLSLLLVGVFFGIAFAIRPFSAVALVWPAVLWCLLRQRGLGSSWWLFLGWMTFGALPGILFVFTYNGLVFGSPAQTGYQVYNPSEVTLTLQLVQTPIAILGQQLPRYLLTLNRLLWGWPWPDLLVLTILFWPRTGWGKDGLLLACASSLILGHSFYYYFDIVYGGPRLVFEALGPIALLLARSLLRLFDILVGYCQTVGVPSWRDGLRRRPFLLSLFYPFIAICCRSCGVKGNGTMVNPLFLSVRLKLSALAKRH